MEIDKPTVFDNFLSPEEFKQVQAVFSEGFPWAFSEDGIGYGEAGEKPQFTHTLYNDNIPQSHYFDVVWNIFKDKLPYFNSLVRIKANLTTRENEVKPNGYHVDFFHKDAYTAVLYLNTTNAPTVFEDGTEVECVANRLAVFPVEMLHSGTTQTDELTRVVINFNWF